MKDSCPDIICAVATPNGMSALAVIRVSGYGSALILEELMRLEKGRLEGRRRKLGEIWSGNGPVDQVVAISWPEGSSYTGEPMVEIMCHGIPETVRSIVDLIIEKGAREAEPGEFTRRAYASGRIDAFDVMVLAAMLRGDIDGIHPAGKMRDSCRRMQEVIQKTCEAIEGDIEFGELQDEGTEETAKNALGELMEESRRFRIRATAMETAMKVLIMGPVNSGKSTLYNILSGGNALVSDTPGTTRDGASCITELGGTRILLSDTAGSNGKGLDGEAYEKAVDSMDGSEKIVWMSQGGRVRVPDELRCRASDIVEVSSKSDVTAATGIDGLIPLSSVTGEGIEELKRRLEEITGRHTIVGASLRIEEAAEAALRNYCCGDEALTAEYLKAAEDEIAGIIGNVRETMLSVERALATLCVGK